MSAAFEYNPNDVLRGAVESIIAGHIEVMLASKGKVLSKGTPTSTAAKLVRGWSIQALKFVWSMAKRKPSDKFPSKAAIAKDLGWTDKALASFWSRLGGIAVPVRAATGLDGTETTLRLFRRTRERKFSGDGIALFLELNQPRYIDACRIMETTAESTRAHRDNIEGALAAVESDESLSESDRADARKLLEERSDAITQGPQLSLVANGTKGNRP
jgi:hypothetical protein